MWMRVAVGIHYTNINGTNINGTNDTDNEILNIETIITEIRAVNTILI
jgi:hypothetical protein